MTFLEQTRGVSMRDALLDAARAAYDQSQWSAARAALRDADAEEPLGADDLERLAWSCRWAVMLTSS